MAERQDRPFKDGWLIRRMLASFSPATLTTGALEGAADLAGRLGAELETLFVEDTAILQLPELPFVREISLHGRSALPLSRGSLELQCRVLAGEAERRLAEMAASRPLRWSFRVVRGRALAEVTAAAAATDLLALASRSRPMARESRLDPSVRALIGAVGAPILLLRPERPPGNPVHVLIESADEAGQLVAAAAALAQSQASGTLANVWTADPAVARQLSDQAAAHLMRLRRLSHPEAIDDLIRVVAGGTLVLSATSTLLDWPGWWLKIGGAPCTLLLVR